MRPGRSHPPGIADTGPNSAHHPIHADTGMPIHRALLHVRMAVALQRLATGASDLSRLALDLGFATHSHFSAVFRRWFGVSPNAARGVLGPARRPGRPLARSGAIAARCGRLPVTVAVVARVPCAPRVSG